MQKCREHSIEVVEVLGKDISRECSQCGGMGRGENGTFRCSTCGCQIREKVNTAANVLKRGAEGRIVY